MSVILITFAGAPKVCKDAIEKVTNTLSNRHVVMNNYTVLKYFLVFPAGKNGILTFIIL